MADRLRYPLPARFTTALHWVFAVVGVVRLRAVCSTSTLFLLQYQPELHLAELVLQADSPELGRSGNVVPATCFMIDGSKPPPWLSPRAAPNRPHPSGRRPHLVHGDEPGPPACRRWCHQPRRCGSDLPHGAAETARTRFAVT